MSILNLYLVIIFSIGIFYFAFYTFLVHNGLVYQQKKHSLVERFRTPDT